MRNILLYLQLALGILPQVFDLVKAVEIPGNGTAKKEAVVALIGAAFESLPDEARKALGNVPVVGFAARVIEIVVRFLNGTGQFQSTPIVSANLLAKER